MSCCYTNVNSKIPKHVDHVFDHIHEQCDGMHKRLVNTIGVALSIKECTTRSRRNVKTDLAVSKWKAVSLHSGMDSHKESRNLEIYRASGKSLCNHKQWRLVNTIGVALSIKKCSTRANQIQFLGT